VVASKSAAFDRQRVAHSRCLRCGGSGAFGAVTATPGDDADDHTNKQHGFKLLARADQGKDAAGRLQGGCPSRQAETCPRAVGVVSCPRHSPTCRGSGACSYIHTNHLVEQYFGPMPEGGAAERRLTIRIPANLAEIVWKQQRRRRVCRSTAMPCGALNVVRPATDSHATIHERQDTHGRHWIEEACM
jgi:hypothetical protein